MTHGNGRERIVHVVVAGDIGGAERLLVDLATRPDATRANHSVALMTPTSSPVLPSRRSRRAV